MSSYPSIWKWNVIRCAAVYSNVCVFLFLRRHLFYKYMYMPIDWWLWERQECFLDISHLKPYVEIACIQIWMSRNWVHVSCAPMNTHQNIAKNQKEILTGYHIEFEGQTFKMENFIIIMWKIQHWAFHHRCIFCGGLFSPHMPHRKVAYAFPFRYEHIHAKSFSHTKPTRFLLLLFSFWVFQFIENVEWNDGIEETFIMSIC